MTRTEPPDATTSHPPSSITAPVTPPSTATASAVGDGPSTARLVGIDLARAMAVFGMFTVHVGPRSEVVGGVGGWLLGLAEGRASVLFATLAGFSLMLITGRREPKTGTAGRQARARVVVRAVILLVVGTVLSLTSFGPAVILNYYGVYFMLALPMTRLRARTLAIVAGVLALVAPQVAFGLRSVLGGGVLHALTEYDPLDRLCGVGVLDLLLTGFYPAITWMPFVVAGMSVARLDLARTVVLRRLAAVGGALVVLGYGVAWAVLRVFGDRVSGTFPPSAGPAGSAKDMAAVLGKGIGSGPFEVDLWLALAAEPHSGSTFDVLGSLGVALLVLVAATALVARLTWTARVARPVIAVGTMSLTVYVGHVLAIVLLPGNDTTPPSAASAGLLAAFVAGATLFATVWSWRFRRGPLEYLLHRATITVTSLVR